MVRTAHTSFHPSRLVDVSLVYAPGSDFESSNLASHIVGIIVARACDDDLRSSAHEHLFSPLGGGYPSIQAPLHQQFLYQCGFLCSEGIRET